MNENIEFEASNKTIKKIDNTTTDNQSQAKRIFNGFKSSKYFNRYVNIERIFIVSILVQIFLIFLYYELSFEMYSFQASITLHIILANTVSTAIINILRQECYNNWKKSDLKDYETTTIMNTVLITIVILIQPYSFLEEYQINNWDYSLEVSLSMKVNYLLVFGCIPKFVLMMHNLLNVLKFRNPRASRVCTIYGCQSSSLYSIKCYFIENPVKMIILTFISAIAVFSFAFRITQSNKNAPDNLLNLYQNTLWLVVVTMTSVGYGDISPRTQLGRIVGFVCTFCGVLIVSIMILVVINTFQLNNRENNSLKILKKVEEKQILKTKAAFVIRHSLWRLWKNYKNQKTMKQAYIKEDNVQKKRRTAFRDALKESKNFSSGNDNISEDMDRNFQKLHDYIEKIDYNFDSMISHLSQKYFLDMQELWSDDKMNLNRLGSKSRAGSRRRSKQQEIFFFN